ncbi:MAG: aldolase [Actinomycetota bacterium]
MVPSPLDDQAWAELLRGRVDDPSSLRRALVERRRPDGLLPADGRLFLIAADHPARGANAVGGDPLAMADRRDLLGRLIITLADPGCDGIMASADILEELAVCSLPGGASVLDGKVVVGTMNRGGLAGSSWELDDRHTAYSAGAIAAARLDGGKMLLRIHDTDPGTAATLELCARYVTELAERELMAMVEPLPYATDEHGRHHVVDDTERLIRCVGVASGLGSTSAHTWLKLPASDDIEQVMAATTMPALILGGAPGPDPATAYAAWERALAVPHVRGLTVGRTLLYPPDGDVAGAVRTAASIVHG